MCETILVICGLAPFQRNGDFSVSGGIYKKKETRGQFCKDLTEGLSTKGEKWGQVTSGGFFHLESDVIS